MKRIGLTGISGSGKSYVSAIFSRYGIPVINTDALVHRLYEKNGSATPRLLARFGDRILFSDGSINRRLLADIVFQDIDSLSALNAIVHPLVIEECEKKIAVYRAQGKKAVLIEAPQLFEAGLEKSCDIVIAVIADPATCIERIMIRDALSLEQAKLRLSNQNSIDFFRQKADYCIENNTPDDIETQVHHILNETGLLA